MPAVAVILYPLNLIIFKVLVFILFLEGEILRAFIFSLKLVTFNKIGLDTLVF